MWRRLATKWRRIAAVSVVQPLVAAGRRRMRTGPRLHPARCRLFRRVRVPVDAVAAAVDAVVVADIAD